MTEAAVRRISDALKVKARVIPDRAAHEDKRGVLTFAEWDRRADEVAGGLAAAGLKTGERVFLAIGMERGPEMAIAAIATMRAGGIACPVNTRLSPNEFVEYSSLLEPRFAITDVPEKLTALNFEKVWTADAMPSDLAALPDQAQFAPQGDAVIVGTSGTTGRPKGVVLSHQFLMSNTGDGTRHSDKTNPALHSMPFTGYGGFGGQCMRPISDGQTSLILYPFDTDELLRLIETKRPVSLMMVPTMLRLMLDHPRVAEIDMSSVKVIVTGTAPVPFDTLERTRTLWPHIRLRNSYSMSEGGVATVATTDAQLAKPGCVGAMPPNMQIRDDNGEPVADGVVGEIWGKGSDKRRYWKDDKASQGAWVDGWTKSGDLGFVDADGDLILTGRSKELIIRGGFNIAPIEIEDVLHAHPAVHDAAVVGVSHDVLGEDVAAAVSLARGASATAEELEAWCRERLAPNKVPRTIVILDALPVNQNAKILKRDLQPILEEAARKSRAARHAETAKA